MTGEHGISIWFFIGVMMAIYGLLIATAEIYDTVTGQPTTVVLANLHVGIWWGILMLVIGVIYTIAFFPRKHQR